MLSAEGLSGEPVTAAALLQWRVRYHETIDTSGNILQATIWNLTPELVGPRLFAHLKLRINAFCASAVFSYQTPIGTMCLHSLMCGICISIHKFQTHHRCRPVQNGGTSAHSPAGSVYCNRGFQTFFAEKNAYFQGSARALHYNWVMSYFCLCTWCREC